MALVKTKRNRWMSVDGTLRWGSPVQQKSTYCSECVGHRNLGLEMVTSLGREGPGERGWEMLVRGVQSARSSPLSLANAFLRQGYLTSLVLFPPWCYALFNPKLSLKMCSTQCFCAFRGNKERGWHRAGGLSRPEGKGGRSRAEATGRSGDNSEPG